MPSYRGGLGLGFGLTGEDIMSIARRGAAVLVGIVGALVAGDGVGAASRPPVKDFLSEGGFSVIR